MLSFYEDYLICIAEQADTIRIDGVKIIYINASEEIINIEFNNNYIKYEKNLILFNDNINQIINIFNNNILYIFFLIFIFFIRYF